MPNRVPVVTIYLWIITILCTTVGESLADDSSVTLGFGLGNATIVFTAARVAVPVVQFRLARYVPDMFASTG